MTGPTFTPGTPPRRFDVYNAFVGAGLAAALVAVLGLGVMVAITAVTPPEEGVSIGGAILATLGSVLGVALAAFLTARRARRRVGQPMLEGLVAGVAGFVVITAVGVVAAAAYLALTRGWGQLGILAEVLSVLSLLPLVAAGAAAGAAIGTLGRPGT